MAERKRRRSWFQRLTDKARGSGAGTEDRNIVGDAGPYDTAPGQDPPEGVQQDRPPAE